MLQRKLLLLSLCTLFSWLPMIAQDLVTVHGTVTHDNGNPEANVNILISAFFADSSAITESVFTDTAGYYHVQFDTPEPNLFGWVQVSMIDCSGTTESQSFTIMNGNEVFQADFVYCEQNPVDSCIVFILQEWDPTGNTLLTAWTPPGTNPIYVWNTGDSSQTIQPNGPGTYCVDAIFPTGCSAQDCFEVFDTSFCFSYIVATDEGNGTYTLEAVAASGIAPFTFSWSTGETTSIITGVTPGTYCVTITDATGCTYATCAIVDDFSFCEVFISEDPASGLLWANAFGTPPFAYSWSTGEVTEAINPDQSGLYCVTITDAVGCETSSCYQYGWGWDTCYVYVFPFITDSNTIGLSAVAYTDAEFWQFDWSNGETGEIIEPIDPAQSYCVTMTDSEGCISIGCYEPSDFCYAWINVNYLDTNLAVLSVGTDSIFGLPGAGQPTYMWSDSSTGPTLTVTESGTYCVTVTIGDECTTETCLDVDFEGLSEGCSAWVYQYADSSGNWYAEAYAWGWGVFEYNWSTGDTNTQIQLNDPNEIVCVTVTSSFGCEAVACTDTFNLPCEAVISINYLSNQEAVLTATVWNDPTASAIFLWNTGDTAQTINVTEEGTYCVTVMAGGCVKTTCVDVFFWSVDSCGVWISEDHSSGSGTLYIANPWGVAPFTYLWSNGSTESTNFIDFGIHELCVTVTDAIGCQAVACNYIVDSCFINIGYTSHPVPSLYVYGSDPLAYVNWSTGDSLTWIEIDEPGTYCVTATTILGCEANACITVDSIGDDLANIISGYVFTDTFSIDPGYVFAYSLDPATGEFDLLDSAQIVNGAYNFSDMPNGVYLLKAAFNQGTNDADLYFPTYHLSSTTWEAANPHTLPNWLPASTDIWMVPTNPGQGGGGLIGGIITDGNRMAAGAGDEDRGSAGVANVEVIIKDVDGNPIDYMWTLENGSFRFPGLAYGTYRIVYDVPGQQSPEIWVTLTPESPEKLGISMILNGGTTAVEEPTLEEIKLYPNPATHEIYIPFEGTATDADVQIMDMQGRVVYAGSADRKAGVLRIDIGSFTNGLYLVNVSSESKMYYGRFVKQE